MTELRKATNTIVFGPEAQQEFRETGHTFGMLGVQGSGKLKARVSREQKILNSRGAKL